MYVEVLFLLIVTILCTLMAEATDSVWPFALFFVAFIFVLPGVMANIWAPFVPSFKKRTEIMLKLAKIRKGETTYDLGAGDGRLVTLAARAGAKSYGYELSYPLVLFFQLKNLFSSKNGVIFWGNFWNKDFSEADVIFCYLYPRTMNLFGEKIYPKLKKGTRIVSNSFSIPSLQPVKEVDKVYLYIKE